MHQVSELTDSTISEAKKSYDLFEHAQQEIEPIRRRFNVVTAKYFTDLGKNISYLEQLAYTMAFDKEPFPENVERCKRALTLAQENHFFHWKLEFPEVFYTDKGEKENPGFDCTVGNPPYVRQEELGSFKKDYLKPCYNVFHNMADLYTYFFERGINSLKSGGRFGMITSNKFMKTNYGQPLRKYLIEKTLLLEIVDFGELPVFEDAATFPAIFIVERTIDVSSFFSVRYAPIRTLSFETLEAEIQKSARDIGQAAFKGETWSLASNDYSAIFTKMEVAGIPLGEYCEGKIKYGVKTGLNEAFVIDRATRDNLIKVDKNSEQFIRPLIVGDDVRKYEIDYKDTYLIVIPSSSTRIAMLNEVMKAHGLTVYDEHLLNKLQRCIDDKKKWEKKCIEYDLECGNSKIWKSILDDFRKKVDSAFQWFSAHYPTLADHLIKYEGEAKKRADKGDFWWELRPCDYYDYFEGPKIVYPEIAMESRFAFDNTGAYPIKTIFTIPLEDKFLLAVLNSKLSFEYLKNTCSVLGDIEKRGRLLLQLIYLEKLPIPRISFTTPEKERKKRVSEAFELYEKYMLELGKGTGKGGIYADKNQI